MFSVIVHYLMPVHANYEVVLNDFFLQVGFENIRTASFSCNERLQCKKKTKFATTQTLLKVQMYTNLFCFVFVSIL